MDTKHLCYFLEICKQGSFSKAAETTFISQQALSASISRLEEELNSSLFIRTNKGVYLTKAGLYFKEQAQQILSIENKTKQRLSNLKKFTPNITIGCSYGVVGEIADKLLNKTELLNRGIQLKIIEYTDMDCEIAVQNGEVDCGLAIGPIDKNLFYSEFMLSRKCCFIVPSSHHLANCRTISIEQLKDEDVIMVNEKFKVHCIFRSICQKHNLNIPITYETGEIAPIERVVLQNYGVGASIDFVAKKFDSNELSTIYLNEPSYSWNVFFICKKGSTFSNVMKCFISFLLSP